jgi:uncharacterized membrane protein YkoI
MRTPVIIMVLLAAMSAANAPAQPLAAESVIEELIMAAAGGISLDEAVSMVEKRFKARVVRAEVKERDGRKVYELRLLDDESGRVWKVRVDAATGSLL